MELTWEHKPASKHLVRLDPIQDIFARVFRQLELNGPLGFAFSHGYTFPDAIIFDQIGDGEFNEIAAAQFAIDGDVVRREIARIARKLRDGRGSPKPV